MTTNILVYEGTAPTLHNGVFIAPGAVVLGRVTLGRDANVWYNAVLRGDVHDIIIGERTNIQDLSMVHATTGVSPTIIGDDVTVGHRAILHGCRVGNGCLIGMGAILLDGVEIGENSLVGAGAMIPPGKKFPPNSVILGAPGRVQRQVSDAEIESFMESARHYVALAKKHHGLIPA